MGKNQHSKDRLFITQTEWRKQYGGKKDETQQKFRPLPFDCCALSLAPFENPVCTPDGVVYELMNIVPYIRKHKMCPVTGRKLTGKDLIRLHMQKNEDGKWHCPVTYKPFGPHSHVIAIKPTGNVFLYEAVQELCLKPKKYRDLLNDTPFNGRSDLITLQDPNDPDVVKRRDVTKFYHVKKEETDDSLSGNATIQQSGSGTARMSLTTKRVLEEVASRESERKKEAEAVGLANKRSRIVDDNAPKRQSTTGKVSGSFTSSAIDIHTKQELESLTEEEIHEQYLHRIRARGEKAYIRLSTNVGNLNLELHVDMVPRTCENFIKLCRQNYYDGVKFHRLIKNFMIQGGDPTGTGKAGESIWKKPFKDEFDSRLTHSGRGILSMANSGKDTNNSQFFITFKSCPHLNNKHSIFGRVVGGLETLKMMENIETDKKDRPLKDIVIINTTVFSDLFENEVTEKATQEQDQAEERRRQRIQSRVIEAENLSNSTTVNNSLPSGHTTDPKFASLLGKLPAPSTGDAPGGVAASMRASAISQHKQPSRSILPDNVKAQVAKLTRPSSTETSKRSVGTKKRGGFGNFEGW